MKLSKQKIVDLKGDLMSGAVALLLFFSLAMLDGILSGMGW